MENSKIAWTDHTFNPWIGCTKVSAGCAHCYAETQNKRYGWVDQWGPSGTRKRTSEDYWRKPLAWNKRAETDGVRPRVFCGSLCDVFENNVQVTEWRQDLWKLIEQTPNLDWLLLTKRPENIWSQWWRKDNGVELEDYYFKNVWLGATVESQAELGRIETLTDIDAAKYFISVEPMLSPIKLGHYVHWVDWVIVGGESGPGCRPMNVDWARSLRDECRENNIAFFMKQMGGYPIKRNKLEDIPVGLRIREFPHD